MKRGVAFVATLLWASSAAAAPPRTTDRAPTDGVDRVYHDYSGEGDASSIELNPALLSTIRGFDLTLLGYNATNAFVRGSGFGAFGALNLGFGLGMGLGFQLMRPGLQDGVFDFDADANPAVTKVSWGFSGGLGKFGAMGVSVHGIRAGSAWLQRPDVDIGLMTRITNFASLGAMARLGPADVRSETLPSELSVIGELALRPLGTHNLELAGGFKQRVLEAAPGQGADNLGIEGLLGRGRISLRFHGIALRGEVEQVHATLLDEQSFAPLRREKALRGSASIEFSWDAVSAGAGVHAGVSDEVDGVGYHARFHTWRRGRVYPPRTVDADRLDLQGMDGQRQLIPMLEHIERARQAGKRAVVVVDARRVDGGWATLHELREALKKVRNAGGHVFAYVESADLKDYYIASVAERIYIHPAGGLETYGISATPLYFKEALSKIGVQAEVVKVREYKSAGERFDRDGPSEHDAKQRTELNRDVYERVVWDIAQARGLSTTAVRDLFDDAPHGPSAAVEKGLVDEVTFRDELKLKISEVIGANVEFRRIGRTDPEDATWSEAPYIAVVLVEGTIVDGISRFIPFLRLEFAGADTITQTLKDLREDRACKGVVLRVDSPGGSALASDVIWREVARTQEAHQRDPRSSPPIVVSMSDVAASGGYYVAMGSKTVLADPLTVTGSIGVITIHFDISGLLDKLGISTATFKEGKNPDITSLYKPYTDDQRARVQKSVEEMYGLFTSRVADGRGITKEKVDELARGHVYSGLDAKELGLVDAHGGLMDAVAMLRKMSGVPEFRKLELKVLPKRRRLIDIILGTTGEPFAGAGPIRNAAKRREEAKQQRSLAGMLPRALDEALAKLPLSLLYLPQGTTHALLPYDVGLD